MKKRLLEVRRRQGKGVVDLRILNSSIEDKGLSLSIGSISRFRTIRVVILVPVRRVVQSSEVPVTVLFLEESQTYVNTIGRTR